MIPGLAVALVLVGGTVFPGDGPPVEGATVVIQGDRIVAVGPDVPAPAGAEVLDVTGRIVTAGFVDPWTGLGVAEVDGVAASVDRDAGGDDPVRAAYQVADAFDPFSEVIPEQRRHGITAVGVAPEGGLVAGQVGAFSLRTDAPPRRASAGLVVRLGGQAEGSRAARLAHLRGLLDDARLYQRDPSAYAPHRFGRPRVDRHDLAALAQVAAGTLPLFVEVHRRADIRAVLALAQAEGVRLVLVGASEAWAEAPALAAAGVPVILDPVANLPADLDQRGARADAAAILHGAGVAVSLSTFSTHQARKLRQWAGNAVRAGLPPAAALAAVTLHPAWALGLMDQGRVAAGARADLVVWQGDPFELSSRAEHVIIDGERQPLKSRQQALFERYRVLEARP